MRHVRLKVTCDAFRSTASLISLRSVVGSDETARLLIERGADAHARDSFGRTH